MHRLLLNHLKHVTGSRYAPWRSGPCASVSHCCSAGTLGFDRACIRRRLLGPSGLIHILTLWNIFWNICHHSFPCCFVSALFVTLGCFVNSLRLPAVGYALVSWVLGSQPLVFFLSSRPFGACFIQPNPMISMPTSPSESLLLFNPWNLLNFHVTGFKNTQASRDNRSSHFHAQLCRCTEFAAPALSRASSRRLNDALNVMSFLRGSDFSRLFLHTTIVCV